VDSRTTETDTYGHSRKGKPGRKESLMGTHGAAAITYENGVHICGERTLDGYSVYEAVRHWIKEGCQDNHKHLGEVLMKAFDDRVEWGPHRDDDGHFIVDNREHEQQRFFQIDVPKRTLYLSDLYLYPDTGMVESPVVKSIQHLNDVIGHGWNIEIAHDCVVDDEMLHEWGMAEGDLNDMENVKHRFANLPFGDKQTEKHLEEVGQRLAQRYASLKYEVKEVKNGTQD
jgi:hypothetical protein